VAGMVLSQGLASTRLDHEVGSGARPSNKELKLTKPGTIGASQLNSSVRRTSRGSEGNKRV
jgi:hypothetical protein